MNVLVILVGIGLVVVGLVAIAKPDATWSWTEWTNSFRGVASERNDRWEFGNRVGGVIAIVAGLFLVVAGLSFD